MTVNAEPRHDSDARAGLAASVSSLTGWLEEPPTDRGINFYDGSRWKHVSYAELADGVFAAAAHLREQGVYRGDRVAVVLPSGETFARYFFGTLLLGATPTPIAPPGYGGDDYTGFLLSRLEVLRPSCVIAEHDTIAQFTPLTAFLVAPLSATALFRFIAPEEAPCLGRVNGAEPFGPEDLALIQFTSGTSSLPRAVTLTGSAVLAQIGMLERALPCGPRVSFSSWLPLHHDMGLIGLFLTPVVLGAELWLMRPEHFVHRPLEWLATFGRHGAGISGVPCSVLARLVRRTTPESLKGMDFRDWRRLIVAADRITYPTLQDAYRLLAPYGLAPSTITPAYGMAEATLAVAMTSQGSPANAVSLESADFRGDAAVRVAAEHSIADRPDGGQAGGHPVVSCGHDVPGVEITVTGDNGEPLADGHVGELRVRSPALAKGYVGDPAAGDRFTAAGFRTGDLGFRRHDQIYVLGRVGDSVRVRGRFVTAEDLELALLPVFGLPRDRIAVVLRDSRGSAVTLVAVQQQSVTIDPARIADVLSAFGLDPLRFCVVRVPRRSVPRTTSGKLRRGQLWLELETGRLRADVRYAAAAFPFEFGRRRDGDEPTATARRSAAVIG